MKKLSKNELKLISGGKFSASSNWGMRSTTRYSAFAGIKTYCPGGGLEGECPDSSMKYNEDGSVDYDGDPSTPN